MAKSSVPSRLRNSLDGVGAGGEAAAGAAGAAGRGWLRLCCASCCSSTWWSMSLSCRSSTVVDVHVIMQRRGFLRHPVPVAVH